MGNVQSKWNHFIVHLSSHITISPKLGSFIHKLSAANSLSSSGSPSITQNGHFTSTTPSPQHLHVAMLSVLGADKSTVHCPPGWRTGSVAMDTPIHACSRRPSISASQVGRLVDYLLSVRFHYISASKA